MKSGLLIALLFVSGIVSSQGLNTELGFNDNYDQSPRALVCVDEYSYLIKFQNTSTFYSTCALYEIDTIGNILWSTPASPIASEYNEVYEMIPSAEGGVYILGFGMPTCDVPNGCFWYIQKFDSTGNVEWYNAWIDSTCFSPAKLTGLSLNDNNEILVNYLSTSSVSNVYTFSSIGLITDSIQISLDTLKGFSELPGFEFVAYKGTSLFSVDTNGVVVDSIAFSAFIQNIKSLNDSLYLLTTDSIFIFDNNLNLLQGSKVTAYSQYSNLKVSNHEIQFVSSGSGAQTILELDKQLQLQNSILIPVNANLVVQKDFNDSHFSIAYEFPLTLHHAIRYLDFSLNSLQNTFVNTTDIGVVNLNITQTSLTSPSPGVYSFQIWADALVLNYGSTVMTSCRINHFISMWGICSPVFYSNEFTNLNLAPNSSMWISLGLIHYSTNLYSNIIDVDLCVYSSHPNRVTDTIVPNDQFCKNVYLGTVGLNENLMQNITVGPNPANNFLNIQMSNGEKGIFKLIDVSGRQLYEIEIVQDNLQIDITSFSSGLYFYRFESHERKYSSGKILFMT